MKFIWLSVAPWAPTGYGSVTRQIVPRIQNEGHEVIVACKHFHTGTVEWNGIKTVQGMDIDMLNRMVDRGEADYVISLLDNHAVEGVIKNWISYTPFDTHRIPYSISRTLEHTKLNIALTKWGKSEIERVGHECMYAPHGVNTSIYFPDETKREEGRRALDWEENFIIGCVGVNYADDRKNLVNLMLAFKWFQERHKEARLFLGVNPLHTDKNDSLTRCMDNLELQKNEPLVKWAEPDRYFLGRVGDGVLANRYRSMDVFCLPTKGEGFGLPLIEAQACGTPVITTNASTGPELCETQYLIDVKDEEWEWFNKEWRPHVNAKSILDKLEEAYSNRELLKEKSEKAVEFARDYDWDFVFDTYWKPILDEIKGLKTKIQRKPNYKNLYQTFNGRITMSDCGKWCDMKCETEFLILPHEERVERPIFSRSYPIVPAENGDLLVDTTCPLHNYLSKKFKKEVKEVWEYLWGFPEIRSCYWDEGKGFIKLEDTEQKFDKEYIWAMQSQYHTNIPDIEKYLKGKVLEVGAGDGFRVREFRDKGIDITGIEYNLAQISKDVSWGDSQELNFEDNSYDVVLSVDVWEHLDEPMKAISEAFRVSSKLVISSITPIESSCFWEDPTHKVEWDRERWKREVDVYGEIIEILEPFTIIARKR